MVGLWPVEPVTFEKKFRNLEDLQTLREEKSQREEERVDWKRIQPSPCASKENEKKKSLQ